MDNTSGIARQEFQQVHGIISLHRSRALQTVNNENLLTAWEVGAFVSARLKNSAWGSKIVMQLSEYLRTQDKTEARNIAEGFIASTEWAIDLTPVPDLRTLKIVRL
jgi:hypothetical protein